MEAARSPGGSCWPGVGEIPATLIEAIARCRGVHQRGFDFVTSGRAGVQADTKVSFGGLFDLVMRAAQQLRRAGVQRNDRVAIMIPDALLFITTFLGVAWAGGVPTPLYPPGLLAQLDGYLEAVDAIWACAVPAFVCTTRGLRDVAGRLAGHGRSGSAIVDAESLIESSGPADDAASSPPDVSPNEPAFLQFTSGSSSAPKGVIVTHQTLAANVRALQNWLQIDPETEHSVSWLPLYHDMGLVGIFLLSLYSRANATFIPTSSFARNANIWLETIDRKRGTLTSVPNFALAQALRRIRPDRLAKWDLSSLRILGCGAEPINPEVVKTFVRTFATAKLRPEALMPCYGMAEATLVISGAPLGGRVRTDQVDKASLETMAGAVQCDVASESKSVELVSCGRVVEGHEVKIADDDGRRLPERQMGEVWFRGPSVTPGYFRAAAAAREATEAIADGWLHTGDLGYVAEGELYIVGRKKDLIIINGRNHDPARVEWVVNGVAGVRPGTAVAFSRPGPASEELVVVAEASPSADCATAEAAISRSVHARLELPCADVLLVGRGRLPKTTSGKLKRRQTRASYLSGALHLARKEQRNEPGQ